MQTIRIGPELIGERLDARYNAPDAVLARKRIADFISRPRRVVRSH
jgi:hypothetical protein